MIHRYVLLLGLCLPSLSLASVDPSNIDEKALHFGEVYFYAYQNMYIDAISRQEIALARFNGPGKANPDPLNIQFGAAKIPVAGFELSYRMHRRAERALKEIIASNVDPSIRNEAVYRLARIFQQNGESDVAQQTIDQLAGLIPESIREDVLFLRAQINMSNGKFTDAMRTLQELKNTKEYKGFAEYNLGVALIKIGMEKQGLDQIDKAGKVSGNDEVTLSIRDKANLALGYRFIDAQQPALGKQYLERVRLSGPFSNKALLGSGWAEVALGKFDKALVPWTVLAKRDASEMSVQESMLGIPYAYSKLELPGKAVLMYGRALDGFEKEAARLDASLKSVHEGRFLKALLRDEIKQQSNWIDKLRSLPESPETDYLLELMASRDFQELLKNYLDLSELSKSLESLDSRLDTYASLRKTATGNNQGFDDQIRQYKKRIRDARQKNAGLMSSHGQMLEKMADAELNRRRAHMKEFQAQARYGLAESYERASRMQSPSSSDK